MGAASALGRDASILSPLSQAFGADEKHVAQVTPAWPPQRALCDSEPTLGQDTCQGIG